jgi:cytochrome c biogenesis protein CcmG/thiol:disulfide interchange protein DsbE
MRAQCSLGIEPTPPILDRVGHLSTLEAMSGKGFGAVLGVLAVVALLVFGVASKGGNGPMHVGDAVPTSTLTPLEDNGADGSLADYKGKWVLVNVWASWCNPCREESPALQNFYEKHRNENFTILGVDSQDTIEDAAKFIDEFGLSYPHLHDGSGDYADELGTTGVPESFLVNPDGKLAVPLVGPVTEKILEEQVAPVIRESS